MENLLTAPQLADLVHVKLGTVYNWASRGHVPCVKLGGKLLFEPAAIRQWVRRHRKVERRLATPYEQRHATLALKRRRMSALDDPIPV